MAGDDDRDNDRNNDRDLARRAAAREGAAWERLLSEYGGVIEAACRRALAHAGFPHAASDVADAASETHRALLDGALQRYRPTAPLGAYLREIARRRTLDLCRKRARRPVPWLEPGESLPDPLEAAERSEHLREALASLPEREREALRLFHLESLPYREIADRLSLPAEQVGVVLLRARELLKNRLGPDFL